MRVLTVFMLRFPFDVGPPYTWVGRRQVWEDTGELVHWPERTRQPGEYRTLTMAGEEVLVRVTPISREDVDRLPGEEERARRRASPLPAG